MRVWHDVAEIEDDLGDAVVTIGNFDGVHLGHQHVIARAHEVAAERGGLPVIAVTFDPHPMTVVAPTHAPVRLGSLGQRIALLDAAGADAVLVLSFDEDLAAMPGEDFATAIVFDQLRAAAVVVGENFRFGHKAAGDVDLLRRLAADRGVQIEGLPLDGETGGRSQAWSSTFVRKALAAGDVAAAARALGRPFTVSGTVERGDQRGRELGYPTANVPVRTGDAAVPADGVYAGYLRRLDLPEAPSWPAAISVGTNPTFDGVDRRVESYVLDRTDLELYDVPVEVSFVEHLRGMVRFDSIDELVQQMADDVDRARTALADDPPR